MKTISAIVLVLLPFIMGCETMIAPPNQVESDNTVAGDLVAQESEPSCIVELKGIEDFPAYIANGVWRDRRTGWEFAFDYSGAIKWIQYDMGKVLIKPMETVEVPMKQDKISRYQAGQWYVSYDASNQELTVIINIENYHIEIADSVIDGNSEDIFIGKISEDGNWQSYWTSYKNSVATSPEKGSIEIPNDPIYGDYNDLLLTQGAAEYKSYKVDY